MRNTTAALLALCLAVCSVSAGADDATAVRMLDDGLWLENQSDTVEALVRIQHPDGFVDSITLPAGGLMVVNEEWLGQNPLDGSYQYEVIQRQTSLPTGPRHGLNDGRNWQRIPVGEGTLPTAPAHLSGSFQINDGRLLMQHVPEETAR